MGYQLLNVLVFTLFGIAFVIGVVAIVGRLLRPKVTTPLEPAKEETYECGEPAVGPSWVRFDIRFYTVALIFLIFDVEVTFLYPWALVFKAFRDSGLGVFVLAEVLLFIAILGVGFVYCWRKGDLDWVKGTPKPAFPARRVARPAGEPIQAAAAARPPAPESPGREAKVPATVG